MSIPLKGWKPGSWDHLVPHFRAMGEMVGLDHDPTSNELYALIGATMRAELFEKSVESFMKATGMTVEQVCTRVRDVESKLGLMNPLPMMSLNDGIVDPESFHGKALLSTGTATYCEERIKQLLLYLEAGAKIELVVAAGGNRVLDGAADRKHPLVRAWSDGVPTESSFQRMLIKHYRLESLVEVVIVEPPVSEKTLNLNAVLGHLVQSGKYKQYIGSSDVYWPLNFNALFVLFEALRLLGLGNIWFSQNGGTLKDVLPPYWAPTLQQTATYPCGAFRFWKELVDAGIITPGKEA